jgi:hypothetical protein
MPLPSVPSASLLLARLVKGHPETRAAIARLVVEEDSTGLAEILTAMGLEAAGIRVEQLLDEPGPFLPSLTGWT